jgi:hypothetical protein
MATGNSNNGGESDGDYQFVLHTDIYLQLVSAQRPASAARR